MTSSYHKYLLCWLLLFGGITDFGLVKQDQLSGYTTRISIGDNGQEGNAMSQDSAISDDGRYIVFESEADNLIPGDYNQSFDIFVYDNLTGTLQGITIGGNNGSSDPELSSDGRYIVFSSAAQNLVPNDNNDASDIFVYDQQNSTFELISVTSTGQQGNSGSFLSSAISPDGRYVAFVSTDSLVTNDTNFYHDVYVRDRGLGLTERVSVDSFGNEGNYQSYAPAISADGRYVAFSSEASNLVANDTNNYADVFLHDRQSGITQRLSENLSGEGGNHISWEPVISDDGRFVVFYSGASNLVANDTNGAYDIFMADTWLQTLERISVSSTGEEGNESSTRPGMSADGRFVTFDSSANNLVEGDDNEVVDVFVRDCWHNLTERVSLTFDNQEAAGGSSFSPVISEDGGAVAFTSWATNLVAGDTNEWSDVFVREVWWPAAAISQTVGAVGSYFGVVVSHFPANSPLSLVVNGHELGQGLVTDENGGLALELETSEADPGYYRVRLGVGVYWQEVAFSLTKTGVVYPPLGGRPVVGVPAGIAQQRLFLPLLLR